jgi:hypothetical protein
MSTDNPDLPHAGPDAILDDMAPVLEPAIETGGGHHGILGTLGITALDGDRLRHQLSGMAEANRTMLGELREGKEQEVSFHVNPTSGNPYHEESTTGYHEVSVVGQEAPLSVVLTDLHMQLIADANAIEVASQSSSRTRSRAEYRSHVLIFREQKEQNDGIWIVYHQTDTPVKHDKPLKPGQQLAYNHYVAMKGYTKLPDHLQAIVAKAQRER